MRYITKEDSEATLVKALVAWATTEQKSQTTAGGTSSSTNSSLELEIPVLSSRQPISGQSRQPTIASLRSRNIFGAFVMLLCVSGGWDALWQQQQTKEKATQVALQILQKRHLGQKTQQENLQETQAALKVVLEHTKDKEAKASADN